MPGDVGFMPQTPFEKLVGDRLSETRANILTQAARLKRMEQEIQSVDALAQGAEDRVEER